MRARLLDLIFDCVQHTNQFGFGTNLDEPVLRRARSIANARGSALERSKFVGFDPALAAIAEDEASLACPFACRQTCRAIAFVGFASFEKLYCRAGKHECHLSFLPHLLHSK